MHLSLSSLLFRTSWLYGVRLGLALACCGLVGAAPLFVSATSPQALLPINSLALEMELQLAMSLDTSTQQGFELDGLQLAMTHGATHPKPKKDKAPSSASNPTASPLANSPVMATPADQAVIEMAQAFKYMDRNKLSTLLPLAQSSLLAPWAAYWELRARLDTASTREVKEFFKTYGLTDERLALARPDAIVMHPGPMNRGVEIDSPVADGGHAVILPQVTFGIAVRMAVMAILAGGV